MINRSKLFGAELLNEQKEAHLAELRGTDPAAYLVELRDINEDRWFTALRDLDPDAYASEAERRRKCTKKAPRPRML
jgi:hypothetical protein